MSSSLYDLLFAFLKVLEKKCKNIRLCTRLATAEIARKYVYFNTDRTIKQNIKSALLILSSRFLRDERTFWPHEPRNKQRIIITLDYLKPVL